jgi:hypothetical protein
MPGSSVFLALTGSRPLIVRARVEHQVAEEAQAAVDRAVDKQAELVAVRARHEDLPLVPVRAGAILDVVDVGGGARLLEKHRAIRAG